MPEIIPINEGRPQRSRAGIGPRIRFETFKRDGFTCRYCGRKTPEVVLEVDHVVPVSAGGDDDMENLVTSCWECNRGKGAALLDDRAPITDIHDQAVLMLEREMQLKEYNFVRDQIREREDEEINALVTFWEDLWDGPPGRTPENTSLRRWLRLFAAADIKDAMEMAADRKGYPSPAIRYLFGIMRNKEQARLEKES